MRALKIVGIILGSIVLLAAVFVGLAFVPAVQTWAVRKAVAHQPGLKLDIGRVSAGFSAAEIRELRLDQDGLIVTIKRVSANYSAWDYFKHKRVNIDGVEVQGLVVDTRTMSRTAPATRTSLPVAPVVAQTAPRAPVFSGVLRLAQLPLDVRLGKLAVDGRVLLSGGRGVDFTLQGGGIEIGQRGQIAWKIDFSDGTKGAPLRALHSNGSIGLHIAPDRRIDRIDLENTAAAEGPGLPPDQVRIELTAEQAAPAANKIYTTRFVLIRGAKTEPVFNSRVEYVTGARRLDGAWNLAVRSEQLAALLAGFGLPEAAANGSGKFSVQPDTPAAAASGELDVRVAGLEKLGPQYAAVGPLQLHAAFDGAFARNVARLDRLEVELATADAHKLVEIAIAQPVSFDTANQRIALAKPGSDLARIALQGIQLAWAQPFVKALTIDSGELSAAFSIAAEADGSHAHLRTTQPLTLDRVTLSDGGKKLVDQASLTLSPGIDYSSAKIGAQIPDLKLALPAGDSVDGSRRFLSAIPGAARQRASTLPAVRSGCADSGFYGRRAPGRPDVAAGQVLLSGQPERRRAGGVCRDSPAADGRSCHHARCGGQPDGHSRTHPRGQTAAGSGSGVHAEVKARRRAEWRRRRCDVAGARPDRRADDSADIFAWSDRRP